MYTKKKTCHADETNARMLTKKKQRWQIKKNINKRKLHTKKNTHAYEKKCRADEKNDPCIRKQIAHTDEKNVHAYENKTHIHPDEEKKNVLVYDRKKTLFRQKRTYMQTKQRCCIHKNAYTYEKKNDHADENKKH